MPSTYLFNKQSRKYQEEILPKPKNKYQSFVHMCDYLSSKKFLNVNFINGEIEE